MRKRLFITMSMAGLAMAALSAQKPKTAKTQSKVAELAPTYTEWHDLQVNDINRFPLHTSFFTFASGEVSAKGEERALTCRWKQ